MSIWSILLLSSIAWFKTTNILFTFSLVTDIFVLAASSIFSAWCFISFEYSLIWSVLVAISATSLLTEDAFSLINSAFLPTSVIVAESSSVKADKSPTLLLDVIMRSEISPAPRSIFPELSDTTLRMPCNLPIKEFIPSPSAAISSFAKTGILLVRSPFLSSISRIITDSSFSAAVIGWMIFFCTTNTATKIDKMLIQIVTVLLTKATLYTDASCPFAWSDAFFEASICALISWYIPSAYDFKSVFATANAVSFCVSALSAIIRAMESLNPW